MADWIWLLFVVVIGSWLIIREGRAWKDEVTDITHKPKRRK